MIGFENDFANVIWVFVLIGISYFLWIFNQHVLLISHL